MSLWLRVVGRTRHPTCVSPVLSIAQVCEPSRSFSPFRLKASDAVSHQLRTSMHVLASLTPTRPGRILNHRLSENFSQGPAAHLSTTPLPGGILSAVLKDHLDTAVDSLGQSHTTEQHVLELMRRCQSLDSGELVVTTLQRVKSSGLQPSTELSKVALQVCLHHQDWQA